MKMPEYFGDDDKKVDIGNKDADESKEELNVPKDAAGNVDPDKAAPGGFPFPASVGNVDVPDAYKSDEEKEKKEGEKVDADDADKVVSQDGKATEDANAEADAKVGEPVNTFQTEGDDGAKKAKKAPKQPGNVEDPLKNDNKAHKDAFKPLGK